MRKYKIFRGYNEGHETISSRRLKSEDDKYYYGLMKEESEKGNKQLILTRDIILGVALDYILDKKYDLIDINTYSPEINEKLAKYIERMKEDRGYLAYVMSELQKDEYVDIYSLTLQKHDEVISLHINGVVSTNTLLDQIMLDTIKKSYCRYVS